MSGRDETGAWACQFDTHCRTAATYEMVSEVIDEPFALCAEHTAVLRANDPLDYIVSVRSLRLAAVSS